MMGLIAFSRSKTFNFMLFYVIYWIIQKLFVNLQSRIKDYDYDDIGTEN